MTGSILVVDDEYALAGLLSEKLTLEGCVCKAAASGPEALSLLAQQAFDLVISDLRMPGMSGLELLEEVRKRHPKSAFVMLTGENDIRVGIQAMKQGAGDYLSKPFDMEVVMASVERALENKRLELEIENYRHRLEDMVERRTKQVEAAKRRIELTYDDTLEALGGALDLRDNETAGHSRRVMRYSLEIAKGMGCTEGRLQHIARGAYLHDIGKIGIPDAILLKQGKLTSEEREVMESHVRFGYELVCRIAFLASAAEIVLTHQERYDGTGYPQGLIGEEIPLGSRIFSVADTLDAMTSDRPYRRALSLEKAREEIARESGHQFDPAVVGVFLSLPAGLWENIRLEVAGLRLKHPTLRRFALAPSGNAGFSGKKRPESQATEERR